MTNSTMKITQHTQGPDEVIKAEVDHLWRMFNHPQNGEKEMRTILESALSNQFKLGNANGIALQKLVAKPKLEAAAPELFEALEAFGKVDAMKFVELRRAAIAKAKGE